MFLGLGWNKDCVFLVVFFFGVLRLEKKRVELFYFRVEEGEGEWRGLG